MKLLLHFNRLIYGSALLLEVDYSKMDTKEFEKLFNQYKADIYRIAYTYVNNKDDALDIVQETAYQAYISKGKIRDKDKFKSWLLKIAVNKSKDFLKRNKPILVDNLTLLDKEKSKDRENLSLFVDSLRSLAVDEKHIIILKIYFEYTFEMIAKTLKISTSTVKSRYYRALEKLRIEEGSI